MLHLKYVWFLDLGDASSLIQMQSFPNIAHLWALEHQNFPISYLMDIRKMKNEGISNSLCFIHHFNIQLALVFPLFFLN